MTIATNTAKAKHWRINIRDVFDCMLSMSSRPVLSAVETQSAEIAAAKAGDNDAFAELIRKHQAAIAQQMHRFSRNRAEVEQLVHDVFVEAFLSLKSYRAKAPLIHWLRKIAVRVGYRFWRSQRNQRNQVQSISELEFIANDTTSDLNQGLQGELNDELYNLLRQLRPRDRLVLTLIYWDDCSVSEVAKLSGWTKTMVKVQAHRARKRLKKLIEEARDEH